jgi:hypothetical protein
MIDIPTRTRLLSQVVSSRITEPKSQPPPLLAYTISVQRRETAGEGRWYKVASWRVLTTETDMLGPLTCGLRDNYRILIHSEGQGSPAPSPDEEPKE